MRDDVRRMGHEIVRFGEDCKRLNEMYKSQAETSFSVDTSGHKGKRLQSAGNDDLCGYVSLKGGIDCCSLCPFSREAAFKRRYQGKLQKNTLMRW